MAIHCTALPKTSLMPLKGRKNHKTVAWRQARPGGSQPAHPPCAVLWKRTPPTPGGTLAEKLQIKSSCDHKPLL